jgi:hypothetical protein
MRRSGATRVYTDLTDPLTREAVNQLGNVLWPGLRANRSRVLVPILSSHADVSHDRMGFWARGLVPVTRNQGYGGAWLIATTAAAGPGAGGYGGAVSSRLRSPRGWLRRTGSFGLAKGSPVAARRT